MLILPQGSLVRDSAKQLAQTTEFGTVFRIAQKEHLIVPAQVDCLASLRDFVIQIGERHGYGRELVNAFKLAIDEAATNIISHAYGDREGYITVQAIIKRKSLTIKLIDQGLYFHPDWAAKPNLKAAVDAEERPGLGIFVIRKLMDHIDYSKSHTGNELTLTKRDHSRGIFNRRRIAGLSTQTKFQYLVHAVLFVTLCHLAVFGFLYFRLDRQVTDAFLRSAGNAARQLARQIEALEPNLLASENANDYLRAIIRPVAAEQADRVSAISLLQSDGTVALSTSHHAPDGRIESSGPAPEIESGAAPGSETDSTGLHYISQPLFLARTAGALRAVRLELSDSALGQEIDRQSRLLVKYGYVSLGVSYIFLALLTYLITQPFRRLLRWVRAVSRGENPNDMDFDKSSDVGEIALAVSELTARFNESQKQEVENDRLIREMDAAQEIQESLLPAVIPRFDNFEVDAYYEPAQSIGGDYYDFIQVDQDTLGIAIADVSGKGVPASLMMSIIRTAIRTEARGCKDAAQVLSRVNDFVLNDIRKGLFVTVLYAIVDLKTLLINFANAGHTPLVLHRAATGKTYYLNTLGGPIGLRLPDQRFQVRSQTFQLEAEDTLLFYTDGLTETLNPHSEFFGEERLLRTVRKYHKLSLTTFHKKLCNTIYSFKEDGLLHDDITFVLARPRGLAHKTGTASPPIRLDQQFSIENRFLSVDEITSVMSVIYEHPEFEASDISWELRDERYNYLELGPEIIASTLRDLRLHTPILRADYRKKCDSMIRHRTPAGIPQLTANGRIKIRKRFLTHPALPVPENSQPEEDENVEASAEVVAAQNEVTPPVESDEHPPVAEILVDHEEQRDDTPDVAEEPLYSEAPSHAETVEDLQDPEPMQSILLNPPKIYQAAGCEEIAVAEIETPQGSQSTPLPEARNENLKNGDGFSASLPETESELIFGNLIEEIIGLRAQPASHGEPVSDEEPAGDTTGGPAGPVPARESPALLEEGKPADTEDISDVLVDSIFDQYAVAKLANAGLAAESDSDLTKPIPEEPQRRLSEDSDPASTKPTAADPAEADIAERASDIMDSAWTGEAETTTAEAPPETPAGREDAANTAAGEETEEPEPAVLPEELMPGPYTGLIDIWQDDPEQGSSPEAAAEAEFKRVTPEEVPGDEKAADKLSADAPPEMDSLGDTTSSYDLPASFESEPVSTDASDAFFDDDVEALLSYEQAGSDLPISHAPDKVIPSGQLNDGPSIDPHFETDLQHAIHQYKAKNYQLAAQKLAEILKTNPDFEDGYAMLGNALYRSGKISSALACYQHLDKYYTLSTAARENIALIYRMLDKHAEAVGPGLLQQEDTGREPSRPLATRNEIAQGGKSERQAVSALVAENNDRGEPGMDQELLQKGIAHYRERNYAAASKIFARVISDFPQEPAPYRYLANVYFRDNMLEEAAAIYEQFLQIDSEDAAAIENLGVIRMRQRLYHDAIDAWRKLLRSQPQRLDIRKKIEVASALAQQP